MEDMLWIENIIENITLSFFINSRVDMASFVKLHKVIVKKGMHFFSLFKCMKWN
jgi:hypothetical protein